jgi:hypothetical protein
MTGKWLDARLGTPSRQVRHSRGPDLVPGSRGHGW